MLIYQIEMRERQHIINNPNLWNSNADLWNTESGCEFRINNNDEHIPNTNGANNDQRKTWK